MKKKTGENYLERVPVRGDFKWSADDENKVTIEIENKGFFNRIAQKIFKKLSTLTQREIRNSFLFSVFHLPHKSHLSVH